jgi:hypothetical protein
MENKKETFPQKIGRIGFEREQQMREYLSKQGYIIFGKELDEELLKTGLNLHIHEALEKEKNPAKQVKLFKQLSEEAKKKYKLILILKDKDIWEDYAVNQVRVLKELGCVLSEKERNYLQENSIFKIGDLTGKRISDNKLVCFEVKSAKRDYFISGVGQFERNCIAKKNEIEVFYVFNNYKAKTIEIVDIAELWFNLHLNPSLIAEKIKQPINLIKKKDAIEKKKKYYSNTFVLFELVKCLKNRELCMLSTRIDIQKRNVRFLLAFSIDYLKKHFKRFDFDDSLINLYHSVALLKPEVPVFSYNLKERRHTEEYQQFNENYKDYVAGYNLFIDIDSDWDWEKALKETLEVKKVFDEFKLPYYILNSSFKGFHLHIPAEYMPKKEISELLADINEVIYNIKGIYDLKCVDTSIFDLKRVCKLPYSMVSDGSVCLPLSDEQLKNFTPEIVKMENVMRNVKIMNRGLLTRTHGLTDLHLKENVSKFIEEFK